MIKGLLLDYGGTIDSNGVHWGELLWTMYQQCGVPVLKEAFREAYIFGERTLALRPLVKPEHDFFSVLKIKLEQQFIHLHTTGSLPSGKDEEHVTAIAKAGDDYAKNCIAIAYPVLEALAKKYPIVLVSNFYGNINAVLEAYGLRHFFRQIIESSVVGVRKPSPEIFVLGVKALGLLPDECAVIGDSYRKDIAPAKEAGCYTVWLKGDGWEEDPVHPVAADKIITSFTKLQQLL